jgi:dihydroorotate dehydrogenase
VPLLVKIAPDLADDDVDRATDVALDLGLDGLIATNTTISRSQLRTDAATVERIGAGGLSGRPLAPRALEVLRRVRGRAGSGLTLVAAGGIESAEDAWQRIQAGATLVQLYTAFVYQGPSAPSAIARGLAQRATAAGYARVEDAIGTEAAGAAPTASTDVTPA